jgi:S-adenosylmethionine:tRNA ribosyltransferase-isomerase
MMINPDLRLSDFDYELPNELIAQKPAAQRTQSRLLRVSSDNSLHDHVFTDLPNFLKPEDLLVFNNTKVIKARLYGAKESGGKIEGLVERIVEPHKALMHLKASKSPKPGTSLIFAEQAKAQVIGRVDDLFEVMFEQEVLAKRMMNAIKPSMLTISVRWPLRRQACILTKRCLTYCVPKAFKPLLSRYT